MAGLRKLHGWLLSLHRLALRHPRKTLLGFSILFILSLGAMAKLQMLLAIDDLIDTDFKTYHSLMNLNSTFSDKNNLLLVVAPRDKNTIINKTALCDLESWIRSQADRRDDINKILSTFGARNTVSSVSTLRFPRILEPQCGNGDSETSAIAGSLKKISASPWKNILTSKDANDVAVNFYLRDTLLDKRFGSFDTKIVKAIMDSFQKDFLSKHRELTATWGGVGLYQYYLRKGYDLTAYLNLGTILLILIVFRLLYGNLKSAWLFILTLVIALVPVYGGLALSHCPIDVLTNILSLMLIVASLEDYMFLSFLQSSQKMAWRRPFRKLLMPSFFTSLTTVIGFGSLAAADLGIIRRFGIWAAAAAIMEWLVIFLFLPALFRVFPKWIPRHSPRKTTLARLTEKISAKTPRRAVSWGAMIVYIIALVGAFHLRVTDAPTNVFPKGHVVRQDMKKLEDSRGWQTEVSLVFSDYSNRSFNLSVLDHFVHDPLVGAVESPYAVDDYLTRSLPDSRKSYVKMSWVNSPAGERLVAPDDQARALLYLKDTDIIAVNALRARTEALCPHGECTLAGSLVSYGEFGDRVLHTLFSSLGLSLLLVSLILYYLLKAHDRKNKALVIASAMWGPASLLALFYVFSIPIFYVTSMFASILVGLAGDNTIQYLFATKKSDPDAIETGIARLGGASVQCSLAMMAISTVFFASYFAPLRILGVLLIVGFFLSLLGDFWLLKGLLKKPNPQPTT